MVSVLSPTMLIGGDLRCGSLSRCHVGVFLDDGIEI
jgi:hypothetical protein